MPLVRENCEVCVGPTREACDALFAGIREKSGTVFVEAVDLAMEDDMVGMMELEQQGAQSGEEFSVALRGLGCTLDPARLTMSLLSESMAGVQLAAAEADAEIEAEELARQERIEGLLEMAENLKTDFRTNFARIQEEASTSMQQAKEAFCAEQGWDIKNLGFIERLEVNTHLRSEGFTV